jgi:hypothetical protein
VRGHGALAPGAGGAHQRDFDAPRYRHRAAGEDGPVNLLDRAGAEGLGETGGDAGRACEENDAGGVAIEAMHEAGAMVAAEAQGIEHAIEMLRDSRAALRGQAGGLVEYKHLLVAINHQLFEIAALAFVQLHHVARWGRRRGRERGHAHRLARREAHRRIDARAIHPHLAGAAEFLDRALRHSREMAAEPAVQADIRLILRDLDRADTHSPRSARSLAQWASRLPTSRSNPRSRGR